jgi:chemotaxis protein MotB
MLRRKRVDININHERWLVSYADFVTLLFAFFVVMYSVSQVNESKYQELSASLESVFTLQGENDLTTENNAAENTHTNQLPHVDPFSALSDDIQKKLADLIGENSIQVSSNEWWIQISLNNRIVFPLGSVVPSQQAENILEDVATLLRDLDNPIQVEGFTDNLSIRTAQFPSNWELSAARSASIVKLLITQGVAAKRLSAMGYGEFQPIADNNTEAGRAENRRVVLMIGKYPRQRPNAVPASNNNNSADDIPAVKKQPDNIGLQPTVLNNGEHLFSSDPDLPRN